MEGKPFAVIETDGHSGDAGAKTRVEAFLHCVRQDRPAQQSSQLMRIPSSLSAQRMSLIDLRERGERVLIPSMGPGSQMIAAALRGTGLSAEALPMPDRESLRIGCRHTSGKECLPMSVTLGSLLQRHPGEKT